MCNNSVNEHTMTWIFLSCCCFLLMWCLYVDDQVRRGCCSRRSAVRVRSSDTLETNSWQRRRSCETCLSKETLTSTLETWWLRTRTTSSASKTEWETLSGREDGAHDLEGLSSPWWNICDQACMHMSMVLLMKLNYKFCTLPLFADGRVKMWRPLRWQRYWDW